MSAPTPARDSSPATGWKAVAGRGGMGVVYKATQLGLDRPVALKVIAAGLLGDPRVRERFLHESRAAAAIEHPNVIPIHDYGEHDGQAYIAMRFVDGDDLHERVGHTGRSRRRRPRRSWPRSPTRSTPRTMPGSSTATSSPRTSCSARTTRSTSATSASRSHALSEGGADRARRLGRDDGLHGARADPRRARRRARRRLRARLRAALRADRARPPTRGRPTRRACGRTCTRRRREPSRLAPGVPAAFDEVVRRALEKRPADASASAGELGAGGARGRRRRRGCRARQAHGGAAAGGGAAPRP